MRNKRLYRCCCCSFQLLLLFRFVFFFFFFVIRRCCWMLSGSRFCRASRFVLRRYYNSCPMHRVNGMYSIYIYIYIWESEDEVCMKRPALGPTSLLDDICVSFSILSFFVAFTNRWRFKSFEWVLVLFLGKASQFDTIQYTHLFSAICREKKKPHILSGIWWVLQMKITHSVISTFTYRIYPSNILCAHIIEYITEHVRQILFRLCSWLFSSTAKFEYVEYVEYVEMKEKKCTKKKITKQEKERKNHSGGCLSCDDTGCCCCFCLILHVINQ